MSHQTRHEQKALKVQRDRNKLARKTKSHMPKTAYKRVRLDEKEYLNEAVG